MDSVLLSHGLLQQTKIKKTMAQIYKPELCEFLCTHRDTQREEEGWEEMYRHIYTMKIVQSKDRIYF